MNPTAETHSQITIGVAPPRHQLCISASCLWQPGCLSALILGRAEPEHQFSTGRHGWRATLFQCVLVAICVWPMAAHLLKLAKKSRKCSLLLLLRELRRICCC